MIDFWQANEPFAISGLIIAAGYILKRLKVFHANDGEVIAKIALNITLPAVILTNVPKVELDGTNIWLPIIALTASVVMFLVSRFILGRLKSVDMGLSMTSLAGYNNGLFAMPMVMGLYGAEGVTRFALIDVGNLVAVFIISYYAAWYYSSLRAKHPITVLGVASLFFRSLPFLSLLVALGMNLFSLELRGLAGKTVGIIADMNRGCSLLAIGVLLNFAVPKEYLKPILPALYIRYAAGILFAGAFLYFLPLDLDKRIALAGIVVMPVGLAVIPYAVQWGYRRESAAAIINIGIPLSFALFWVVWILGESLR